jgi:hydroxyacylglutathione hydrolase
MKRMNRDGPGMIGALPDPPRLDPDTLEGLLADGGIVVDTRAQERFAAGHVPGTLNVQLDNGFPNWCGWFLPYDRPIHFIAHGPEQAREAARDLVLIGIDNAAGYFDQEALDRWEERHGSLETSGVVDWSEAEALASQGGRFVDVRKRTEWNEGHVPGAAHIHLGYLRGRASELPRDIPLMVYCRTGNRSGIGMSLLQAEGFTRVVNVDGGIVERQRRGLPVEVGPGD